MISFILNLPYTLFGIFLAFYLQPKEVRWSSDPYHILFRVKKDTFGIDFLKNWKGMTVGHTIILNPKSKKGVLEHEVVHVRQFARLPFIFPFLYLFELCRHGYKGNRYELEASLLMEHRDTPHT